MDDLSPPRTHSPHALFASFALFAVQVLAACAAPPSPAPVTLRVETTDLAAPLLADLVAAYAKVKPDVSIVSTVVSPQALSADLAAGRADLGLAARRDPGLSATPMGYVSFSVVVHPANLVASLSLAQVREIFAGRVNDWGQVGGTGGAIRVISREAGSDAGTAFEASALLGASPTLTALVAPTWAAMREAVSQNANAVGYLPAPEVNESVKGIRLDTELRALIAAVAAGEPSGAAREFLAWAQSDAGQKVVAQRYEAVR